MLAAFSINSNSGGVVVDNNSAVGVICVEQNTGGANVVGNALGSLTVTGNTGTVVDRPNQVIGFQQLQ